MLLARAPVRVSFAGGGTDLPSYYSKYGGFVVTSAINRYVYINLNTPQADDLIRVKYSKSEQVDHPDDVKHPLVREALKLTGFHKNIEISTMADVPAGTGMGTSGSFLIALLAGLHALKRNHMPTQALAEEACKIEIEVLKERVGKQDQYIAAFGGLISMEIDKGGRVAVTPLNVSQDVFDELESSICLYYTGVLRNSWDIHADQDRGAANDDLQVLQSLHIIK